MEAASAPRDADLSQVRASIAHHTEPRQQVPRLRGRAPERDPVPDHALGERGAHPSLAGQQEQREYRPPQREDLCDEPTLERRERRARVGLAGRQSDQRARVAQNRGACCAFVLRAVIPVSHEARPRYSRHRGSPVGLLVGWRLQDPRRSASFWRPFTPRAWISPQLHPGQTTDQDAGASGHECCVNVGARSTCDACGS